MSEVIVTVDAQALQSKLAAFPSRFRSLVSREIVRLSIELQAAVKEFKLSGQVLNARTGTLRRSINREVKETPTSIESTIGTNVSYAAAHEFGFSGVVTVKGHVRKTSSRDVKFKDDKSRGAFDLRMSLSAAKSRNGRGALIAAQGVSFVTAHQRRVNLPERSFLRSTLAEFEPQVRQGIANAVEEALK